MPPSSQTICAAVAHPNMAEYLIGCLATSPSSYRIVMPSHDRQATWQNHMMLTSSTQDQMGRQKAEGYQMLASIEAFVALLVSTPPPSHLW